MAAYLRSLELRKGHQTFDPDLALDQSSEAYFEEASLAITSSSIGGGLAVAVVMSWGTFSVAFD